MNHSTRGESTNTQAAGPALALLELDSIARGLVTVDALLKKASVTLSKARSVSPGRYLIRFEGGVGEVEAAYAHGREMAAESLLDNVYLPGPHQGLWPLLAGMRQDSQQESLGLVECYTSASAIAALDAALKAADVTGLHLELGNQLGGKGFFVLSGPLEALDAALEAAREACSPGMLQRIERVARPVAEAELLF